MTHFHGETLMVRISIAVAEFVYLRVWWLVFDLFGTFYCPIHSCFTWHVVKFSPSCCSYICIGGQSLGLMTLSCQVVCTCYSSYKFSRITRYRTKHTASGSQSIRNFRLFQKVHTLKSDFLLWTSEEVFRRKSKEYSTTKDWDCVNEWNKWKQVLLGRVGSMGETIHEGWLVKSPPDKKSQSLPRFFQAVSRHDFPVNYIITVIFKHTTHAYVQVCYMFV